MNQMIRRVAKAICCPSGSCENDGHAYDPIKGSVSICQAGSFEREARGAVAAMREPTIEMLSAAAPFPEHLVIERNDTDYTSNMAAATAADRMAARSKYQTMIDAALVSPADRADLEG